jgi:hypothetical protein
MLVPREDDRCPDNVAHNILKGIVRRVVHRAGIASTLEPPLRRLPGLAPQRMEPASVLRLGGTSSLAA